MNDPSDALRAHLDPAQGPDPIVTVDGDGRVLGAPVAWPWPEVRPAQGAALSALFEHASAVAVAALVDRAWLGVGEACLTLRDGRHVSLSVAPIGAGVYRIALHDVTALQVLVCAGEQRRRTRALADLAGSLARELTDPMSIVQGRLELLLDLGVSDPEAVRRHLDVALDHARRVAATLRNLRLVGWTPTLLAGAVSLGQVVEEALGLLGRRRERVLVRVEPPDLQASGEGPVATRVLSSVLRQALESAGRASVHLRARRRGPHVVLRIGPSGKPTSDAEVDGEELALDRTLLASIGGVVGARRSAHGLQFEMVLQAPPRSRARRRAVRGRIAVVGSQALHEAVCGLLAHDGFEFACARTGDEGLAACAGPPPVDAVVTELLLDGSLSGLSLAGAAIDRNPGLRDRVLLVCEGPIRAIGVPVVPLLWPLGRGELLEALGHRVRR